MKLKELRALRWQMIATAALFLGCIPLSITVICFRDRFERYMFEKYSADSKTIGESLKALIEAAEVDASDEVVEQLARLDPQQKELVFEDWMQRQTPPRPRTPATLVEADRQFFLQRAEQSVVCGNAEQQTAALDFLLRSEADSVQERLDRLHAWAKKRRLPGLVERIENSGKIFARRVEF